MTSRGRVLRRAQLALVALGLLLLAWAFGRAGTTLIMSVPLESPDAIVSLASREWERLPLTAALATQHPDAAVLLTLPQEVTRFNCHDCTNRVSRLAADGVSTTRVHVLPIAGPGTYGEAVSVRAYLEREGRGRLLVVTSAYHTRRALATFRAVLGRNVTIGVQPATARSAGRPERWWRTPYDRWYVRYEWMAIVYYALRYGIVST